MIIFHVNQVSPDVLTWEISTLGTYHFGMHVLTPTFFIECGVAASVIDGSHG